MNDLMSALVTLFGTLFSLAFTVIAVAFQLALVVIVFLLCGGWLLIPIVVVIIALF